MLTTPNKFVFAWFKSGRVLLVEISDELTEEEAHVLKNRWDYRRDNSEVCRVTLENRKGEVLRTYLF